MNVEDVAPSLTKKLQATLPTSKKRTFTETFENEVKEEENDKPITDKTKQDILRIATSLTKTDPSKYLPVLEKLNEMSEKEAQLYLECIKASVNYETYGSISLRLISAVAEIVCHPSDDETKLEMINDTTLENLTSQEIGSLMLKAGKAAILFLILFYGATSWARTHFQVYGRQKQTRPFTSNPISDDGRIEEQDGEIDSDGEIDAGKVD